MNEAFWLRLFYAVFFVSIGVQGPFLPQWLQAQGIEGLRMGLLTAILPTMGLIGPPVFGLVADAFGLRGALLRFSTLAASLAIGSAALLAELGRPLGIWGLGGALVVFSLFRLSSSSLIDVIAMEHVRRTGASYGSLRVWGSIGFLASALVSGRYLDLRGLAAFPAAVAAPLLGAFLLGWTLPARGVGPPSLSWSGVRALLRERRFRLFLLACFFGQTAQASYDLCISLYFGSLGASGSFVGLAWALGVLCEIVLMFNAAWIFDRFGPQRVFVFSLGMAALRWTLIGQLRSLDLLLSIQFLHGLSFGLWWISSLAAVRAQAPEGLLATAQGLFAASSSAGLVVGLLIWSDVYKRHGGAFTFSHAALLAAAACLCAWRWRRLAPEHST